jgi:hypothetical protein
MSGTSIYVHSCIVCFNVFLKVDVYCINYTCFQKINVKKEEGIAVIVNVRLKEKLVFYENSAIIILLRSMYYILKNK